MCQLVSIACIELHTVFIGHVLKATLIKWLIMAITINFGCKISRADKLSLMTLTFE